MCSGDPDLIDDRLKSFPSGHTSATFADFAYLYLYLNTKRNVFVNYHPAMWKLIIFYVPISAPRSSAAPWPSMNSIINWYDIFAGAVIGRNR